MIDRENGSLSVRKQCELLEINRSTLYYHAAGPSTEILELMELIDKIFIERPYFGARRMREMLRKINFQKFALFSH